MALVRLRRHAPEAQDQSRCSVCGAQRPDEIKDHLLVGPPGTPSHDGAVCQACGLALDHVAQKFGSTLTIQVEEARRAIPKSEI